ncbi:MAG: DUF4349 domain-containing protein [Cytophagales bacterium]|nr:DUF4349 domain-containing protein [Cytophagales bacterium]
MLPRFGASVVSENQSKSEMEIRYQLSIKVPATAYDSLYLGLSTLAAHLDHRYSNVEDVTERYYDLKTRIRNKKALEQRYLDLLNKAVVMKDMLEIEAQLNQVRTEVEQLEGQFNYLSQQVAFSTIQLSFYEVLPYAYDKPTRRGFGARVLSSLATGWQGFLSFLVGVLALWPFFCLGRAFGGSSASGDKAGKHVSPRAPLSRA